MAVITRAAIETPKEPWYTPEMVQRMESIIEDGKKEATKALTMFDEMYTDLTDVVVRGPQIQFTDQQEKGFGMVVLGREMNATDWAKSQLNGYVRKSGEDFRALFDTKEHDTLLAKHGQIWKANYVQSLNNAAKFGFADGAMFRNVKETVRGVLSTSYLRIDTRPTFGEFIQRCMKHGMVPMAGHCSDKRNMITMLIPKISEIAPGEYVIWTLTIGTSDFGAAPMSIDIGPLRIFCRNLAHGITSMRRQHRGSRGGNMDLLDPSEYSQKTIEATQHAVRLQIGDVVDRSQERIVRLDAGLKRLANGDEKFSVVGAIAQVQKEFGKDTAEKVKTLYEQPDTNGMLPKIGGAWKFSNTLSLFAQQAPTEDKRIELQYAAAKVLGNLEDADVVN